MDAISNVILYVIAILLSVIGYFLMRFVKAVDKNNEITGRMDKSQAVQQIEIHHMKKKIDEIEQAQVSKEQFEALREDFTEMKIMLQKGFYP